MTMTNPDKPITKQDLADFYGKIQPYLGGTAEAGFTPVGTVIAVMGTTAPAHYLACDGTVYNISDYRELSDYFYQQFGSKNFFGGNGTTTFAVPDLRGEFLRGTGTNSHTNQGSGANVGVHQDATEMPIIIANQTGTQVVVKSNTITSDGWIYPFNVDNQRSSNTSGVVKNSTITSSQGSTGDTDNIYSSRPTNTSVLYCIATKNIYLNPSLDYSTEEKIVGTWIDGSYIYQKTYSGLDISIAYGSWVSTVTAPSNCKAIISGEVRGGGSGTTYWGFMGIDIDNGVIQLFNNRNTTARVTEITIRYIKNS